MKVGIVTRLRNDFKKRKISEKLKKNNIEMKKVNAREANIIKNCDLLLVLNDQELKEEMVVAVSYAIGVGVSIFFTYEPVSTGLRVLLNATHKSSEVEIISDEVKGIFQKIKNFEEEEL